MGSDGPRDAPAPTPASGWAHASAVVAMVAAVFALGDATGLWAGLLAEGHRQPIVPGPDPSYWAWIERAGRVARGVAYAGMAMCLLSSGSVRTAVRALALLVGLLGALGVLGWGGLLAAVVAAQSEARLAGTAAGELAPILSQAVRARGLAECAFAVAAALSLAAFAGVHRRDARARSGVVIAVVAVAAWLAAIAADLLAHLTHAWATREAWGVFWTGAPREVVAAIATVLAWSVATFVSVALVARIARRADR